MKRDRMPKTLALALPLATADDHRTDLTRDEWVTRMCFAVHEAAHFVVACRIGLAPLDAYVRVPRKSPKALSVFRAGGPGVGGLVSVSGTSMQDAVVAAAGVVAQVFLPNDFDRVCANDFAVFNKWINAASVPEETKMALLDSILAMVDREWKVIDAVASCMLHCADTTGYLRPELTARLIELVRCMPNTSFRESEFHFSSPLQEIPVDELPMIKACREHPFVRLTAPPDYKSPVALYAGSPCD